MNRLLKPEKDSVDRQATFETDSTQAHRSRSGGIKRGTLALPIVGSESSLKTPPIKERTFETDGDTAIKIPDIPKNKKQTKPQINGKNGINISLKDNGRKDKESDDLNSKEKSETKGENKKGKSEAKDSRQGESQSTEKKAVISNSKERKPIVSTKTLPFNIDSEKNTKNNSSNSSVLNKKTKEETGASKAPEHNNNTLKKPEVGNKSVSSKTNDASDTASKSTVKKEFGSVNTKQYSREPEVKNNTVSPQTRPSKAEADKENKGVIPNKKNKSDQSESVQKVDKISTTKVNTNSVSQEVESKNKKQAEPSDSPITKSEQWSHQSKTRQNPDKRAQKTNVYESKETSKSKTSVRKSSETEEDAISIDLLQFEGENFHLPPTSTALKDRHLEHNPQIGEFTKSPNGSQSSGKETRSDPKNTVRVQEINSSDQPDRKNTEKQSVPSSPKQINVISDNNSKSESVDGNLRKIESKRSTKRSDLETDADILNHSNTLNKSAGIGKGQDNNNFTSASSTNLGHRGRSTSPIKQTRVTSVSGTGKQEHTQSPARNNELGTSQGKTKRDRSFSPEKQTHTLSLATSSDKVSNRLYSPDIDRYENLEKSNSFEMEPSKTRQPGSERMTESYESVYAERKTLLEAEITYKKRIKQLEDELNQFLRTIDDLRAENKALRSRIDELESNTESVAPTPTNHQSKSTVVIDTEKIGLEARIEDLEKRNKDLEQRNTEVNTKVRLALSENKTLSEKYEELKKRNEDLENEKKMLLTASNEKLQKDNKAGNEEQDKTLEDDLKKHKTEIESLKQVNENLQKENDKFKRHQDLHLEEVEKLKQQVVDAKIESKKLEVELEKYRELATPRPEGAKSPNTEKMELKAQIIGLQTDNQSLNEEIIKMKADHLQTLKKLHDLEKTATSFQSSVTAVESEKLSEIQTLQNENSKLKTENKTLQEALAQKKTELQELMVVMKDDEKFDTEIKDLTDEKSKLTMTIEEKDEEMKNLKKEIDELKNRNEDLANQHKTTQGNVESLAKLNDARKTEIAELQKKLEESKAETEKEKNNVANLAKAEKDIEEANSRASKLEKDLENERIKNTKQIEELKAKHEKEIKDLNESHEQENEEWRKKYIELEKENQEEIRLLKLEIERLKGELEKLNGLKSAAKELEEAKGEIMTLQNKYSQVVKDLEERSQVEQRNFELSLKIDTLNKKIKQLEKENKEFLIQKDNANDIDSSTKRLTEENKRLREIVDKANLNTKIEVLERKQKDNETRVKQLEGWVGDLYEEPKEPSTYAGKHRAEKKKKQPFSKAPVPTVSEKTAKRPRSLDEVNVKIEEDKMTHSSTPSLPNIFERDKNQQLSFGLGYSQIHKRRLNTSTKYKK